MTLDASRVVTQTLTSWGGARMPFQEPSPHLDLETIFLCSTWSWSRPLSLS